MKWRIDIGSEVSERILLSLNKESDIFIAVKWKRRQVLLDYRRWLVSKEKTQNHLTKHTKSQVQNQF